jgi:hypothetical protein
MRNCTESSIQVLCAEYQRLLKNSQVALSNWNKARSEIHNTGRREKAADNLLRTLQANFAKAWASLECHEQACHVCQIKSMVHSRIGAATVPLHD